MSDVVRPYSPPNDMASGLKDDEGEEDLAVVKARTMHKMVDIVPASQSGERRVCFMSAQQASIVHGEKVAVHRLLFNESGFAARKPRLVVQIFHSDLDAVARNAQSNERMIEKIDHFLAEVLLPLCAKYNAIILANGSSCGVSTAINRVTNIMRARWGDDTGLPFTVITCINNVPVRNLDAPDGDAHWKELYEHSKAWQRRHRSLHRALESAKGSVNGQRWSVSDVDPHGVNFIVVDRTQDVPSPDGDPTKETTTWQGHGNHHFHHLVSAIDSYLTHDLGLPSIGIKAGGSEFVGFNERDVSSLLPALNALQRGQPLLLLDGSPRQSPPFGDIVKGLLERYKKKKDRDGRPLYLDDEDILGDDQFNIDRRYELVRWAIKNYENTGRKQLGMGETTGWSPPGETAEKVGLSRHKTLGKLVRSKSLYFAARSPKKIKQGGLFAVAASAMQGSYAHRRASQSQPVGSWPGSGSGSARSARITPSDANPAADSAQAAQARIDQASTEDSPAVASAGALAPAPEVSRFANVHISRPKSRGSLSNFFGGAKAGVKRQNTLMAQCASESPPLRTSTSGKSKMSQMLGSLRFSNTDSGDEKDAGGGGEDEEPDVNEFLKNSLWCAPTGDIEEVNGFDVSDLAYVVDFLNGDGDPLTADDHDQAWNQDDAVPLWKMIQNAEDGIDSSSNDSRGMPPASPDLTTKALEWLAHTSIRQSYEAWKAWRKDTLRAAAKSIRDKSFTLVQGMICLPNGEQTDLRPEDVDKSLEKIEGHTWAEVIETGMHPEYHTSIVTGDEEVAKTLAGLELGNALLKERIRCRVEHTRLLAQDAHCFSVNMNAEMSDLSKTVNDLVQADRLPAQNSLEGLRLVKQAWDEHDVAAYMAARYKLIAKWLFRLQLLCAFALVVLSVLGTRASNSSSELQLQAMLTTLLEGSEVPPSPPSPPAWLSELVSEGPSETNSPIDFTSLSQGELMNEVAFAVAMVATLITSLDAFLKPKAKWRQLRSCCSALESSVWMYRTRIEPFEQDRKSSGDGPEEKLRKVLIEWRQNLTSAADLNMSTLRKQYPSSVYKHFQKKPDEGLLAALSKIVSLGRGYALSKDNDHFSPMRPEEYIQERLVPMIQWYEKRIPRYYRRRIIFTVLSISVSVAASVLARYSMLLIVTCVAAFGSMVTSYDEYLDTTRKIERYNRAISKIKNLLSWWESLGSIDKVSRTATAHLIKTGEEVFGEERLAWQSTSAKNEKQEGESKDDEDENNRVAE